MVANNNNDVMIKNGHLVFTNGDLVEVSGINRIIQQISVGLRILIGDWILDRNAGVDYFGGLRMYPEILSAQIKKAINSVNGVDAVLKYNFTITDDNIYVITATVKIGNSEIPINDKINLSTLGEVE